MAGRLGSLLRDERGVTITEFALIAPVLLIMLMGIFDLGYNMYAKSVLQGAMQQAARDATIEGATALALDNRVRGQVHSIVPRANVTFTRRSYGSFIDVARAEDYDDVNGNGACDDGEPFEDANGNGYWDDDRGTSGNGDAREAVLYTASMSYARAFPLAGLIGISPDFSTSATTVLRNQPFTLQPDRATTGNC